MTFNFVSFTLPNIVYVLLQVGSPVKSEQITCSSLTPTPHLWPYTNVLSMFEITGPIVVEVCFKGST